MPSSRRPPSHRATAPTAGTAVALPPPHPRARNLDDLRSFVAVARARSFTRAAAQLGLSRPALSHAMTALEARLGVRLLNRTTRSVSPTQAGERLLLHVGPRFEEIEIELAALGELRAQPAGTVRISAPSGVASAILLPKLARFLKDYPDIRVEISTEDRLVDIVAERFDAGIREGGQVAKDMVAVRVGPDQRMAVVGAPAYFHAHPPPRKPQDLPNHRCVNLRLSTRGGLYAWEFEKGRRRLNVHVDGPLVLNRPDELLQAALAGVGLAYVLEGAALPHIASGALVRVLADWCPASPGYHLYYPSRRHPSQAFTLLVEALRHRQ